MTLPVIGLYDGYGGVAPTVGFIMLTSWHSIDAFYFPPLSLNCFYGWVYNLLVSLRYFGVWLPQCAF